MQANYFRVQSLLCVASILLLSFTIVGCGGGSGEPTSTTATYPQFKISGTDSFSTFTTSATDGLAEVYVEFPDRKRYFLPEITASNVSSTLRDIGSVEGSSEYGDGVSRFVFENGQLKEVKLSTGLAPWKIAAKQAGPYYELPISKADLVAAFGEPEAWE